jgi:tryptophan 2,3-dioxygenase
VAARKSKPRGTRYHNYILREDEHPGGLLSFQTPYAKGKRAHDDEHLFIVTHQAFELWFNQLIEEIRRERTGAVARIEAGAWGPSAKQVRRMAKIAKLLADQYGVIGTISPSDFLVFRDVLRPSSGYDSSQFRALELASGLRGDGAYLHHLTGLDADREGGAAGLSRKVDAVLEALERGRKIPLEGYSIVRKLADQGDLRGLRLIRGVLGSPSLRDAAYEAILEADLPDPPWPAAKTRRFEAGLAREWQAARKSARAEHASFEVGVDGAQAARIQSRVIALYRG